MDKKNSESTTGTSSSRDEYLRNLNKLSHKISKPTLSTSSASAAAAAFDPPNPPPHQPPVYNINKSDFRDVVQKLTGSPAHHDAPRASTAAAPRPASSRLHRIRPPPLAHFAAARPHPLAAFPRPPPLSPLPPLPAVHAAAESPVSAYMRYFHCSTASAAAPTSSSGFSPQQGIAPPPPPPPPPPSAAQFQMPPPSPPIPFGCLNSPRSPYPLLLSPSSGQLGFPLSPTVPPMPSPRWRGF